MYITDIPYFYFPDLQGKTRPPLSLPPKHLTHSEIQELSGFTYHQSTCTCGWTGHYKLQEIDANLDGDEHCITQALMEGR